MGFPKFIEYCQKHIKGDEKGEGQIFLDHFFTALGYEDGLKGAGAECEFRLRDEKKKTTSFGDLVWKKRVLIEMKKSGEDLSNHLQQATSYWLKLAGDRPRYVILCNFDEFWIYDFDLSIYEPAEKVLLTELEKHKAALSFLNPIPKTPIFGKDFEDITAKAVEKLAAMFKSMVNRGVNREDALRYALQCIVSMFAEDVELLPDKIFSRLVQECITKKVSAYDLIGGLFREMNTSGITPAGKYEGVDYFNGGLFEKIIPLDLTEYEITMLNFSAAHNWRNVNPAIFGTIFEKSLELDERHKLGAHYTREIDIKKIVDPVIVQPWIEKIENADTIDDLYLLLDELTHYKVLDPACGSGNFLFVAFKELKLIEKKILSLIRDWSLNREDAKRLLNFFNTYSFVNTNQFFGLDIKPFSVELAKVTLMVAKEVSWFETKETFDNKFKPLPLDNLDKNVLCVDALLHNDGAVRIWPIVDAIIGNPPYQSKNKMQEEFGVEYINKLWMAYPEMNKKADFCTYWFYKAHKHLKQDCYAGLVATNSIRQLNSRENSLDFIVSNGGTIFDAVSSEPWSGDAAVSVSIVNWKKGDYNNLKKLYYPDKENILHLYELDKISSDLKLSVDVSAAKALLVIKSSKDIFLGQTHGHEGFLIQKNKAIKLISNNASNNQVLKPMLIGDEFVGKFGSQPSRFVIDFTGMDINEASKFKTLFEHVKNEVLPDREKKAKKQEVENNKALKQNPKAKINKHHINFYNNWWKLSYGREELKNKLLTINRYIACSQISLRPIFDFISSEINPNATLVVFAFEDDYSFGIIQSSLHSEWLKVKGSTFEARFVYIASTVWDTFPWPQKPTQNQIEKIAQASKVLRTVRNKAMKDHRMSLRDLYRLLEQPGKNPIKDLHSTLDKLVLDAYGFDTDKDLVTQLLNLNLDVSTKEKKGLSVQGAGLPNFINNKKDFISKDCVKFDWEAE